MKALFLTIATVMLGTFTYSQTKIENYPFGKLEVHILVMPFGMEHPIQIGTMSQNGELHFDFPKDFKIPDGEENNISSELWYNLFPKCDDGPEMIAEGSNIFSFKPGFISLWTSKNRYVGIVFPVSNENQVPWMEDASYNDAELGTYYELIYVAKPFQYIGECISTETTENGDVQVNYSYQLDLQTGFQFLKFQIESIHKTSPNERASFPDKVSVSNVEGIPNCLWVGKYF